MKPEKNNANSAMFNTTAKNTISGRISRNPLKSLGAALATGCVAGFIMNKARQNKMDQAKAHIDKK